LYEDGTVTAVDPTQVVDLLAKFSGNDLTGSAYSQVSLPGR